MTKRNFKKKPSSIKSLLALLFIFLAIVFLFMQKQNSKAPELTEEKYLMELVSKDAKVINYNLPAGWGIYDKGLEVGEIGYDSKSMGFDALAENGIGTQISYKKTGSIYIINKFLGQNPDVVQIKTPQDFYDKAFEYELSENLKSSTNIKEYVVDNHPSRFIFEEGKTTGDFFGVIVRDRRSLYYLQLHGVSFPYSEIEKILGTIKLDVPTDR